MTTLNDAVRESQEQIIGAVQQAQRAATDAFTSTAKTWGAFAPGAPTTPFSAIADALRPEAAIDGAFDYAQKLLDVQRELAGSVVAALTSAPAAPKHAASPFSAWWLPSTTR